MRKKINQYKLLLFEICETLVTICLYLSDRAEFYGRNYRHVFRDHASCLKKRSNFLVGRNEDGEL